MASTLTPNMSLIAPTIGSELSPTWAQDLNSSLTLIDQHSHVGGQGVQITPAAMNINTSLPFASNSATGLLSTQYNSQSVPLASSIVNAVYVSGGELYFNNSSGTATKITVGGAVNATSSGISSGNATASFSSGVLVVNQATSTPGNIQAGSVFIGPNTASPNFIEVSAPAGLASSYQLTLPQPPAFASQNFLSMFSNGIMGAPIAVSAGITNANIAQNTITGGATGNIGLATITTANVVSGFVDNSTIVVNGSSQLAQGQPNYVIGASIATGNVASGAPVTTASVSLTTRGYPIEFRLIEDGGGSGGAWQLNAGGSLGVNVEAVVQLVVDGSAGGHSYIFQYSVPVTPFNQVIPPSSVAFIVTGLSAAAHTFAIKLQMATATGTTSITNAKIFVKEIVG